MTTLPHTYMSKIGNVTLGRPARLKLLKMRRLPVHRAFRYSPAPNSTLSRCVSEMAAHCRESMISEEMDAHFDGGEWSGPAHSEMRHSTLDKIARKYGFTDALHVHNEVERRTSSKYAHFGLGSMGIA